MKCIILLFIASAGGILAQPIPGRYIVELQTDPASSVSAARHARYSAQDTDVAARRGAIRAEHAVVEANIRNLGGTVTNHYDTAINGMAANLTEQAAAQVRRMPNVKGVYPVGRHHALLDHAVNVHRIPQAWQTLPGGMAGAGAGIKIGILDSGIDDTHPGFQNFTTPVPPGFPMVSSLTEAANTNNKIIVSRVYSDAAGGISNTTGMDLFGHGTGVAMIAAGVTNNPGAGGDGPITGVASGAWLGNYKVADDNGHSDDSTFLAGLDDAINDGMNVVNYSYGGPVLDISDENGLDSRAIASAVAAGVLVVVAAGNDGPYLGSIGGPAVVPSAIAVGASENERFFWNSVTVGSLPPYIAILPDAYLAAGYSGQISGPMVDVTALDGNGSGCNAFPANSLTGQIALIARTPTGCSFDTKINNAQAAGAVGAIIYDILSEAFFDYTVDQPVWQPAIDTATLPALFLSQADGQTMLAQVNSSPGVLGNLDIDGLTSLPHPSNVVSWFSSGGPSPGGRIKPDILAVGDWYITADTTEFESQISYAPYTFIDTPVFNGYYANSGAGTSFATPLITGALAVLMANRPGLSAAQYRSLILNSAREFDQFPDGSVVPPQVGGAGLFDMLGALQSTLSVSPSSVSGLSPNSSQAITVTNTGANADTFAVTVQSLDNVAAAAVDTPTFALAPGASQQVTVSIPGGGSLAPGQYHGFLTIAGTQSQTPARVPYWYGVPGASVQYVTTLSAPVADSAGSRDVIVFRSVDLVGLPIAPANAPAVTTSSTRARVLAVIQAGTIPGTYEAEIQIGRADANGLNVFTITMDGASVEIPIVVE